MKRKLQKICVPILCLSLMFSSNVFAESKHQASTESITNQDATTEAGSYTCEVETEIASTFTVTMPKKVEMTGSTVSEFIPIYTGGSIAGDEVLIVEPNLTYVLKDSYGHEQTIHGSFVTSSDKIRFRHPAATNKASNENVLNMPVVIHIEAEDIPAGHWEGKISVDISLEEL